MSDHTRSESEFDDFDTEEQVEEAYGDEPEDQFRSDVEADAETLASAGWGTDEDYGYYGEEGYWGNDDDCPF